MPKRLAPVFAPRAAAVAGFVALLVVASPAALAQTAEFCVRCSGPNQTYRCKVTGVGKQYSDAAKLFCVLSTTKSEGHAKCTASRDPNCRGPEKVYAYSGGALPDLLQQNSGVQDYKNRMSREQQKFATPEEEGRSTLFDLGKGMIDGTKSRFGYGAEETPAPAAPSPQATAPRAAPPPASAQRPSAPAATAPSPEPESEESFAHRSYRCMKSFFFNCGSEDASN
ncbi:hypothetical protein [Methyloligella solikamskensis]|uniref:Uncharacterized protein n=1 Tax=Methyloligella solikamskensis TaxID=1177756 RepID=A0ABW3JA68_9HYPH